MMPHALDLGNKILAILKVPDRALHHAIADGCAGSRLTAIGFRAEC
jgi:hypothetical protein